MTQDKRGQCARGTSNQQHTFHPLIKFYKRVHMFRTFKICNRTCGYKEIQQWKGENKTSLRKTRFALSCSIYLVIWVLRWLRASICNCTISMIRQEDVSHRIFQALWSCFHNKVVIVYSTLPWHYLHIIVLICYWHSLSKWTLSYPYWKPLTKLCDTSSYLYNLLFGILC